MSDTTKSSLASDNQSRQRGLDILKCFCAFLVVCIHAPFQLKGGNYFLIITRIAVPTFFLITGFFYNSTGDKKKIWKQIRKTALLLLTTTVLFFLWEVFWACITGNNIIVFLKSKFNWNLAKLYFLYNRPLVGGHLWYVQALLYTLVIAAILNKIKLFKLLYILAPLLMATDLILGTYSQVLLGKTYWHSYLRNYVFVGIPNFALGNLIGRHKGLLQNKFGGKNRKKTVTVLATLAILSCVASLLEYHFLKKLNLLASRPNYIGTVFFTFSTFLIFALFYKSNNSKAEKLFSDIGRDLSGNIYIYHPIVIDLLGAAFSIVGVYYAYSLFAPIAVFMVTTLAVYIPMHLKKNKMKR